MPTRKPIGGEEDEISRLIVQLIRDNVCGVAPSKTTAMTDEEETVRVPEEDLASSSLRLLRFAGWLRGHPGVRHLTADGCKLTEDGVRMLVDAISEGLLPSLQTITLEGVDAATQEEAKAALAGRLNARKESHRRVSWRHEAPQQVATGVTVSTSSSSSSFFSQMVRALFRRMRTVPANDGGWRCRAAGDRDARAFRWRQVRAVDARGQ